MTLAFDNFPQTLDLLHLILAAVALAAIVLALTRKSSAAQPGEVPAPVISAPPAPVIRAAEPDSALQLLALLQQEARLVDFLKEDLRSFSDADVGAVARVLHEGGKKLLADYFTLEPVRTEAEESSVTVVAGFDPTAVRLTGNVVGQAPFTGVLVHRGWQVVDVRLPKLSEGKNLRVIAPAEVEL